MAKVMWTVDALNDLAGIGINAGDRKQINETVDRIESDLATSPLDAGESREDGRRVLLHAPLAVAFVPEEDGRTVWVHSVWYYARRNRR